jgi:DNA-binding transcriptional MerR regulator
LDLPARGFASVVPRALALAAALPRHNAWVVNGARATKAGILMRLKRTYSSREVAAFTGLSARQLQLWDASGLMASAVRSHRTTAGGYTERRYSPIDLFELVVLADLRRRGFSVRQLHEVLRILKEQFGMRLFDATGGGAVQLLTDDRGIYARTEQGEFFNLLETPTQPLLVIGEEGALKELGGKIRSRRRRRKKPRNLERT